MGWRFDSCRDEETHMSRFGICSSLGVLLLGCAVTACGSDDGGGDSPLGTGGFASGGFPQGTGGAVTTGGTVGSTGGVSPNGGTVSSGGVSPSGGSFPTGGSVSTGGIGSGGDLGSGGVATGGAPATGGAGTGAAPGTGGAGTGGAPPASKPPCIAQPAQEAAILGDSYVTGAASPALQPALGKLDASVLHYKNYAVPGTSMATGGITGLIPPQLDSALSFSKDIKFILMDGGGNDILICDAGKFPGCNTQCNKAGSSSVQICKDIVNQASAAAEQMLEKESGSGIKDIIYFFYPHIPSNNGGFSEILDYSLPIAKQQCDGVLAKTNGKTTCHFIDFVPIFQAAGGDRNPANFAADGIHPSQAGQDMMAKEINRVMKEQCIGQPASSGCCQP
jgi:lysophospholipase L1-like esterase